MNNGRDEQVRRTLAALNAWAATGSRDHQRAVRDLWSTPTRPARPPRPALPTRMQDREAAVETARKTYGEVITRIIETTKLRRGVPLEHNIPKYPPNRWENTSLCGECDRRFVELDENGTLVKPCPRCRTIREKSRRRDND